MTSQTKSKTVKTPPPANADAPAITAEPTTKGATLIALLSRIEGATLGDMMAVTGWQAHTTRAALTRLKARGYAVTSVKADGIRTYRVSGPAAS